MMLIVNGETLEAQSTNLAALLAELGYEGEWIATAVNGEVVASRQRQDKAFVLLSCQQPPGFKSTICTMLVERI